MTGDDQDFVVLERAVGVVMAQMEMDAEQARECLLAQATVVSRGVGEVAEDLVERRLRMTASGLLADE